MSTRIAPRSTTAAGRTRVKSSTAAPRKQISEPTEPVQPMTLLAALRHPDMPRRLTLRKGGWTGFFSLRMIGPDGEERTVVDIFPMGKDHTSEPLARLLEQALPLIRAVARAAADKAVAAGGQKENWIDYVDPEVRDVIIAEPTPTE